MTLGEIPRVDLLSNRSGYGTGALAMRIKCMHHKVLCVHILSSTAKSVLYSNYSHCLAFVSAVTSLYTDFCCNYQLKSTSFVEAAIQGAGHGNHVNYAAF